MSPPRSRQRRAAIALISDFGPDNFYVGAMKGAVLGVDADAVLVDVTHRIRAHDILQGSFVLNLVLEMFPPGSVFLCVVDPGVGGPRINMVFETAGRFVVAPDNGLISDVAARLAVDEAYSIREEAARKLRVHPAAGRTFLGRDIFGPVAAGLARGVPVAELATPAEDYVRLELPAVSVGAGSIEGSTRHVDSFGNIMTNISGDHIRRAFGAVPFSQLKVMVGTAVEIRGIHEYFAERAPGELFVLLNSWDLVELAVNQGRAVDRVEAADGVAIRVTRM